VYVSSMTMIGSCPIQSVAMASVVFDGSSVLQPVHIVGGTEPPHKGISVSHPVGTAPHADCLFHRSAVGA
jgi:hypothetical protein